MKSTTTFFLLIMFAMGIVAQTPILSLSSDTFSVSGYSDEIELVADGEIFNNHPLDTVWAKWERIVENIPGGWDGTAVCDNNQCYHQSISFSPASYKIAPGGSSTFDVHFYPADIPGNGTVRLRTWVVGDSANTVVVATFLAEAAAPVSSGALTENERIRIYPNPAKDYILIRNLPSEDISVVEVYNIFGRKMISFSQLPVSDRSATRRFDIAGLPKGIYMVRVFDAALNVIYTKSLSKE